MKRNDRGLPKPCKVGNASACSLYWLASYWGPGAPWKTRQKLARVHVAAWTAYTQLTAFSNPELIEDGVNRIAEQARAGDRGIEEESLLFLPDLR